MPYTTFEITPTVRCTSAEIDFFVERVRKNLRLSDLRSLAKLGNSARGGFGRIVFSLAESDSERLGEVRSVLLARFAP